jgi:uncharacterized coiled-coil DUF342 family protein
MIKSLEERTTLKLNEHDNELNDIRNELNKLKQMLLELSNAHDITVNKVTANTTQINELNDKYNDLHDKVDTTTKDLQHQIDELRKYINNKFKELNSLIEILMSKPGQGGDLKGLAELIKRVSQLENDYALVQKDITKLYEVKADKKEITARLDEMSSELSMIRHSLNKCIDNIDKHDTAIQSIQRTIDEILLALKQLKELVHSRKQVVASTDGKIDMSQYVHIDEFNAHKSDSDNKFKTINEEIEKLWKSIYELFELLKGKADKDDIEKLREYFLQQINELAKACNTKFADKNEVAKNFRYLEQQIKKLYALLNSKNDINGDNWLLAKKPLNGFSCASCEAYIGELRDNSQYVPWNKYPLRDPNEKLYRIGSGFSKMLQMLNIEGDQQNNNSTEGSNVNNVASGTTQGFYQQKEFNNSLMEENKKMPQRGMSANVALGKRNQGLPNLQGNRRAFVGNNSTKAFGSGNSSGNAVVGGNNTIQYEEQKEGPTITKIVKRSNKQ